MLCKSYLFVITCNTPLSAVLLVAISVDRYFCICHPFLHVITQRRAKVIIFSLSLFAFSLGILTSLTYGIFEGEDSDVIGGEAGNATSAVTSDAGNVTTWMGSVTATMNWLSLLNGTTEADSFGNSTKAGVRSELSHGQGPWKGQCVPVFSIMGQSAIEVLQKFHVALFLICLIILAVMYVLIYR